MFLTDRELINIGPMVIDPFDPARVQPASYDLALFGQILVPKPIPVGYAMDLRVDEPGFFMDRIDMGKDGYVLHPNACVLGCTEEYISCPDNMVVSVEGKSSLARIFLVPHLAAGWIDPSFHGQITLEIKNFGPWPLRLYPGMLIAQMNMARMTADVQTPYGSQSLGSHYQGQTGPTPAAGRRGK